ncbi:MAG: serine--tRNA ligase [Alphaproteobacteria bacterium]|nr:serine--tRNA ligase [Alphaproteobacteria bacterium]
MFDLKAIRDNPQNFDKNWARRGLAPQTPVILALDERRRAVQTQLQTLQQERNEKSKLIGQLKAKKENADAVMAEVVSIKVDMENLEEEERDLGDKLTTLLSSLPNQLSDEVPDGADEHGNVEVRKHGEPLRKNDAIEHHAIGELLGMMDFETAGRVSGSRFVFIKSQLARLERALGQFMLDTHTQKNGYTEISPPLMVNDTAMYGTAQLPKFAEDQFKTTTGHWLIPTAEVVLTNMVNDLILNEEELPLRFTALTPCFRSEAGAAGKDTTGMIRQHQFYKVEMVSITTPDKSIEEHERMTECAEGILKSLGLSYRTMALCAGDIGFGSRKTYDIEVWLPGQARYREISSCSNCWDFQARRMKARCRLKSEKDTKFVHTLNGSGLAVGRALIAVMENYYDPMTKSITVPDALLPYMGGLKTVSVAA